MLFLSRMNKFTYLIDENNESHILEWLEDRRDFQKWFSSLVAGSFLILTIFGNQPGSSDFGSLLLSVSLALLLFSVICSLICVLSIPAWKFGIKIKIIENAKRLHMEINITTWLSVISYVSGLTIGFVGNLSI